MQEDREVQSILLRSRILQMMAALERTGGTPIEGRAFHAFAFFTNVLSPLWDLDPLEGSVLKESTGPYYPALQKEIDFLVGNGLLKVISLKATADGLESTFGLEIEGTGALLNTIDSLPDEASMSGFLNELASAFLEIRTSRRDDAALVDASYSDPAVASGRIVDYAEWVQPTFENASWNAAQSFQKYMPTGITLNRAEKLLMYMRLLKRRANG